MESIDVFPSFNNNLSISLQFFDLYSISSIPQQRVTRIRLPKRIQCGTPQKLVIKSKKAPTNKLKSNKKKSKMTNL